MNKKSVLLLITVFLLVSCNQEKATNENETVTQLPKEEMMITPTNSEKEGDVKTTEEPTEPTPEKEDDSITEETQEPQASVKIIELSQTYTSPAGEENVRFTIDISGETIENVSVTPVGVENPISNKKITSFADAINTSVTGKTLEEAENIDIVGGSSLTTGAFTQALKDM